MTSSPRLDAPAVFLDRDGVLNQAVLISGRPHPPADVAAMQILPGVKEACQALKSAGFTLVVVTNQPDIARGSQTLSTVNAMHDKLRHAIDIDDIVVCAHDDVDDCPCRKPKPGMMLEAADRMHLDLARSYLVGDRWRDIEAARRAGVHAVHVDRGYAENVKVQSADATVDDLSGAAQWILRHFKTNGAFQDA